MRGKCARLPLTLTLSPEGRGDRLCSIFNIALVFSLPHWGEGRCLLHTQPHRRYSSSIFFALHPPVADAPDQAGAGDRPVCLRRSSNWRRRSSYCLRRSSLTSRCQPSSRVSFIVSPTVRVISVANRLLNIANGVVDNIGLGRNGGQRERGE